MIIIHQPLKVKYNYMISFEAPLLERIEERLGQLMERIEVLNTTVLTVGKFIFQHIHMQ